MTNEATIIETPTKFARYSVLDDVAIPIGTILKLSGGAVNTAVASSGIEANEIFAGIAYEEKTASDGITEISTAINGIWDIEVTTTDEITIGGIVTLSGANIVRQAAAGDLLNGGAFGKILELGVVDTAVRTRVGTLV